MLPISTLYELIKTLSKSEKRYFRIEIGERSQGKSYTELYNLLTAFERYGEAEHRILKKRFGFHPLEIARKHLSKVLIHTLCRYQSSTDSEALLWDKYSGAKLLFHKGFTEAGIRYIAQGKETALKAGHTHFFAMFSKLELENGVGQKFAEWDEERLVNLHEALRANTAQEEAVRMHSSLYEILLCRYWKNGVVRSHIQKAQLNDIVLEELHIVNNHRKETFSSAQLHLHFQSVYFMMTGDLEGSLRVFYSLDELFQTRQAEWISSPGNYLRFLQDVLGTLRCFEAFDEMNYFLSRLESLSVVSQADKSKVSLILAEHRLHIGLATGNGAKGTDNLPVVSRGLDKVLWQDLIQWKFTLARCHLSEKDYPGALKLVNELLQSSVRSLGKMNYSKIRILQLMIHHAMENRDYLFYEIRSFERKMKKGETWHSTEKLVVDYLRHWLSFKRFDKLKEDLARNLENPYERIMVSELGLKKWLEVE